MAAKQESQSKTRINPLLAEQGQFAVEQARSIYDEMNGTRPSTFVGISDERQDALNSILHQARSGESVGRTALDEYNKTMSGGYLNDNPHLDEIVRRSADAAGGSQISQFASAGRFGGGTHVGEVYDGR